MTAQLKAFLNGTTMYRLVVYLLGALALWACALSVVHLLPFSPLSLLGSLITLIGVSIGANWVLSKVFRAVSNVESGLITALILFFILTPPTTVSGVAGLVLAGAVAMAVKYLVTWCNAHVVNPAAFAAVVVGAINGSAHWWVATLSMLPAVAVAGWITTKKMRRFEMAAVFLVAVCVMHLVVVPLTTGSGVLGVVGNLKTIKLLVVSWPILFLAAFMLTEPLTTPPTRWLQLSYAGTVGMLAATPFQLGAVSMTPELALVLGNALAFFWHPRSRHTLTLLGSRVLAADIYEFRFEKPAALTFEPGQYLEWTLGYHPADSRGNRRYFSPASSPLEPEVRAIMRIPERASTFKQTLAAMVPGDSAVASHAAGDFTLPTNSTNTRFAFFAGGVGITPFLSMIRHALATSRPLDATLFYVVRSRGECIDLELLASAHRLGVRTICLSAPQLTHELVSRHCPGITKWAAYISGPPAMVESVEARLRSLGVPKRQIHTDYFTGY